MSAVRSGAPPRPSSRMAAKSESSGPLSSLVYQSRAAAPLSDAELQRLVTSAKVRNRREGVTGLLVHDQGRFLQWLEGPSESVGRVWDSIRHDRRHTDVCLLGESRTPSRFFHRSPMALGQRSSDSPSRSRLRSEFELPSELVETLYQQPQAAPSILPRLAPRLDADAPDGPILQVDQLSLRAVVESVIVPELVARHARPSRSPLAIDPRAAELARLLVGAEPKAAFALIDTLRADGRSIAQLCAGLFEPAARALGDLWQSDDCSDLDVTVGLGHLQVALRRASFETPSSVVPHLPHATPHVVLVAPSPHEPHLLGSVIASEMFWRAGWDVRCEFPDSDDALNRLVHDRWFDVLDLSLSGAYRRDHRLTGMAASIRAAHAHSLNPALTVVVNGRVFFEDADAYLSVGADSDSASAEDVLAAAQRGR